MLFTGKISEASSENILLYGVPDIMLIYLDICKRLE